MGVTLKVTYYEELIIIGNDPGYSPALLCRYERTMPLRSSGVFGPETIAEMSKVLGAAFDQLRGTGEP
jgi:hypothetical protein